VVAPKLGREEAKAGVVAAAEEPKEGGAVVVGAVVVGAVVVLLRLWTGLAKTGETSNSPVWPSMTLCTKFSNSVKTSFSLVICSTRRNLILLRCLSWFSVKTAPRILSIASDMFSSA
jgi:hypothetical protein